MTQHNTTLPPRALTLFCELITTARRKAGRLQKELADAIGIDPHVLSRKLHGAKKSVLTQTEVKQIIQILADWEAITTQDEACTLLATMGLKRESFSTQEWQSAPLNRLEVTAPTLHNLSAHPVPQVLPQSLTLPSLPIPATSLIGREEQIQMVHDLLRQGSMRLLTLFGTGGVGKTRLALAVAHAARHDFADGIFFLPLASLQDVALIPATLVQFLRLRTPRQPQPADQLTDSDSSISHEALLTQFLQHKHLLLIFDNVEHLPAIGSFINALLQQAPALKIMVTSRVLLHLYGEYAFDVPPLDTWPGDHHPTQDHLDHLPPSPAMQLFLARAQAVSPTFALTPHNAVTVSRICTHLDGLPLAIELAAARSKVVPLSTILQRLTNGTAHTFLRTTAHNAFQRHQTLQATLYWSYALLPPSYQQLLRSCSIFVGGWTLEAAQAIVTVNHQQTTGDDILTQLEFLIDQSLVKRMPFDELSADAPTTNEQMGPRFYLLETIRDYALHLLEAAGERAAIQQRHAAYYHPLVVRTEPLLSREAHAEARSLLLREHGNLRVALAWATEHNHTDIALQMSSALGRFWEARIQFYEAHEEIDAVFTHTTDSPLSSHTDLLMGAARLEHFRRCREIAQDALQHDEAADEPIDRALFQIGDTYHTQDDYAQATSSLLICLDIFRTQADQRNTTFTLTRLGALATLQGNLPQARLWLDEAMGLLPEQAEPGLRTVTFVYLGILSFLQRDLPASLSALRSGLLLAHHSGSTYMFATALLACGCVLGTLTADPSYSARLCSAAETLYARLDTSVPAAYRPLYLTILSTMQAHVSPATWLAWWTEGQTLSLEDCCALVLSVNPKN
ncbi:tetratricopeptide repeat protein [Ktedonobacteria bacterium brp13]|nr:tetratricopeptide repeat protein [Ktedonobacteria bacterium brp13]